MTVVTLLLRVFKLRHRPNIALLFSAAVPVVLAAGDRLLIAEPDDSKRKHTR